MRVAQFLSLFEVSWVKHLEDYLVVNRHLVEEVFIWSRSADAVSICCLVTEINDQFEVDAIGERLRQIEQLYCFNVGAIPFSQVITRQHELV